MQRRRLFYAFVVAVAAASVVLLAQQSGHTVQGALTMNPTNSGVWLEPTSTICIGRFLLDVPKAAVVQSVKGASGSATALAIAPTTLQDFRQQLKARWDEIRPRLADEYGKPYLKAPELVEVVPDGMVLNYDHVLTRGPDVTGKSGEWRVHTTEGHLWKEGVTYRFDEGNEQGILQFMRTLQPMAMDQVPSNPGFCGPRAFIAGGPRDEFVELHVVFGADPPVSLHVSTSTYVDAMGLDQLRPPRASAASMPKEHRFRGHLIAEGPARVGALEGLEWIVGYTEQKSETDYLTTVSATWFGEGVASSSDRPAVRLQMARTYRSSEPPDPWGAFPQAPGGTAPTAERDAFMGSWGAVKSSFRLRPAAL